jgi:hypothetical protein
MVRLYVNLADEDVTAQHRKFSPMDRLFNAAPEPHVLSKQPETCNKMALDK